MYQIAAFLHLIAAATWFGGLVFIAVVVPLTRRPQTPPGTGSQVLQAAGRGFRPTGWVQANYVPSEAIMQLRELTRYRMNLEDQIGDAKRRILMVLDRVFPEHPDLFSDAFIASSRALLKEAVSAADFASSDL